MCECVFSACESGILYVCVFEWASVYLCVCVCVHMCMYWDVQEFSYS